MRVGSDAALGRLVAAVGLEQEWIEAAVLGQRAVERRMATQDERAEAPLLGGRLGLAPAMPAGIEHVRQPGVGIEQDRLDDDAAEEPFEHDAVERLERLRDAGEQRVELGELGLAQVLVGRSHRAARRRRRFRQAHRATLRARRVTRERTGGADGRARPAQPARRAATRRRTSGSSDGSRCASCPNSSSCSASSPAHASPSTLMTRANCAGVKSRPYQSRSS